MRRIGYRIRDDAHHESTRAYSIAYHNPLVLGGVEAGGIVGASVKDLWREISMVRCLRTRELYGV